MNHTTRITDWTCDRSDRRRAARRDVRFYHVGVPQIKKSLFLLLLLQYWTPIQSNVVSLYVLSLNTRESGDDGSMLRAIAPRRGRLFARILRRPLVGDASPREALDARVRDDASQRHDSPNTSHDS